MAFTGRLVSSQKPHHGAAFRCLIVSMRFILASALLLGSCAHIQRNSSEDDAGAGARAFHSCVHRRDRKARISKQISISRVGGRRWKVERVFRRRVRVETVLRGEESRPVIDIYEAFPTGVLSGDWNSTQDNRRYLFPVVWRMAAITWRSISGEAFIRYTADDMTDRR